MYTLMNIYQNVEKYMSYPSMIIQKENDDDYLFPKIRVCSNSMHSRKKIERFFPGFDPRNVSKLYGLDVSDRRTDELCRNSLFVRSYFFA